MAAQILITSRRKNDRELSKDEIRFYKHASAMDVMRQYDYILRFEGDEIEELMSCINVELEGNAAVSSLDVLKLDKISRGAFDITRFLGIAWRPPILRYDVKRHDELVSFRGEQFRFKDGEDPIKKMQDLGITYTKALYDIDDGAWYFYDCKGVNLDNLPHYLSEVKPKSV